MPRSPVLGMRYYIQIEGKVSGVVLRHDCGNTVQGERILRSGHPGGLGVLGTLVTCWPGSIQLLGWGE